MGDLEFDRLLTKIGSLIVENMPSETFADLRTVVENAVESAGTPPADAARKILEIRKQIVELEEICTGRKQIPPGPAPSFHWTVLWLLDRSFSTATRKVGRQEAARQLDAVVRPLLRGHRGRPRRIPRAIAVEAKRLRDQGLTYRDIAKKLDVPREWVGTTIRQLYPKKTTPSRK